MADPPGPLPSRERLEQVVSAGLAFTSEPNLDRLLEQVVRTAVDVIGAKYAAVGVLGPDGRMLERFVTAGVTPEERARIGAPPRGHGILGLVIREATVIRLPDLSRHPDSYGFPPNHPPMHSFLGVPIIGRRGTFGNLYLTEKIGAEEFSPQDEYIARLFAAQVAAAVENAQLHDESARLLEEVQRLHRNRERFFAMVNHELRNALAATFGWAEMLVRKKDPATVPRAAMEVLDSAEQAVKLINDLLDLSRLDEDRLKPKFQAVGTVGTTRRVIGRVKPNADARGITISLASPPPPIGTWTDIHRLEQILVNLLTNAIRHSPDQGIITVTIEPSDEVVSISVHDQGPGVPEPDLERIFDVYETGIEEGHGLGLPLSRRLAQILGGTLRAERPLAGGGFFRLTLPAANLDE